jgi:creatinine amidohydrolase/Fe(II)-dependent formamide hydrolase-like protein
MPPLAVGCGGFDAPGTVEVRAATVRNLVYDYGASFARHGFRYLFLCNGHGAVTQLVELEDAARAVERKYGMKMVSLSSSIIPEILGGAYFGRIERFLGRPLSEEERAQLAQDTHAGLLETSVMLELRPEQVGEYRHLPPYTPSRFTRLIPNHAVRIGGSGYVGYPGQASRELGRAAVQAFVEVAYQKMIEAMENPQRERPSALARVPLLRAGFRQRSGLVLALACAAALGFFLAARRQQSPDS